MIWSHNDQWMLTADHSGFVKYWQSNMNNVKMFQAHKDPVRGLRWDMLCTIAASAVCRADSFSSPTTVDIQACFLVSRRLMIMPCLTVLFYSCTEISLVLVVVVLIMILAMMLVFRLIFSCWSLIIDSCWRYYETVFILLSLKAVFNKRCLVFQKKTSFSRTMQTDNCNSNLGS